MIQKVNSLSSNVYTSHGEILKNFFFFFKYVELPTFLSFLRQNRNKTCPELTKLRSHKKISGEHALEPSLQSWVPAEIFVGGGASP